MSTEPLPSLKDRLGWMLGVAFLILQVGLIGYARFVPERYFCWGPYDQCTRYTIETRVDGHLLDPGELWQRYRIDPDGWDQRSPANIISIVRRYERTLGNMDHACVTITYTTNGHPQQVWKWPES